MTTLTNAQLIMEDGVVAGSIIYAETGIEDVQPGAHGQGEDCEGDFVAPGLIECHTDNLDRHFVPRPGVIWPDPLAAALVHDAQIVASGITTVYDAVCVGGYDDEKDHRPKILAPMLQAVEGGIAQGLFRATHRLHFRCEMTDSRMMGLLEKHADSPSFSLASLMDHTLGQRQWRNLDLYRRFIRGEGRTDEEIDRIIATQIETTSRNASYNFGKAVDFFRDRGIVLASHDDTTVEHVADAVAGGCTVSEFPTTIEAARAARKSGMKIVGGAPNVVRGGSHSGGVAIADLASRDLLDVLSSDYVPASLLQAVHTLAKSIPLHKAFSLVTSNPADMLGHDDRGRLRKGLRADLIRYRLVGGTPVIRSVIVGGTRVF